MSLNLMIWNVRGVANKPTRNAIKRLIISHKVVFLAIIEPLTEPDPDLYSRALGLSYIGSNSNGKIWIFIHQDSSFEIEVNTEQVLHGKFSAGWLPFPVYISAVYGKCTREGRYPLWNKLRDLAVLMEGAPWLVGGDFNTILHASDREGSATNRQREMIDLAETIEDCRLIDPGFDGSRFTWAKNNLFERLDRILVGETWATTFSTTRVTNLPRICSDHGPLLTRCDVSSDPRRGGSPFRFQNMWIRHHDFIRVVRDSWTMETNASGLLQLQIKLKRLKAALKTWNKNTFGNIFANLQRAEEDIATAQRNFEADPSSHNRSQTNKLIAEYILLLKMEEDFWRQKAAIRWIAEGDRNTKFYQSWVKQKRIKAQIHSIKDGDRTISGKEDIQASAAAFFQNLLAPPETSLAEPDLNLIKSLPVESDWSSLTASPDSVEIKEAVFSISGDSTPGPDGFTASFYHKCWDIVGSDVVEAVRLFFNGAYLPRSITATTVVLIPKKPNPEAWTDYRPISLCNVSNKIITKILMARLTPLLPLVIAPNQSGFIKGRLLSDNVLLTQEMFHELHRCNPSPNVALKLDMAKAYDRVQWPFLLKILERMGFPRGWVSMIDRCIGSCWFSILVNGSPSGFFKSTRGLRQGDPISPALFVIAADYLSRSLDKLILGNKDMVFKSSRLSQEISHLAYADDIIIFTQAAEASLHKLRICLDEYMAVSGQLISLPKSSFFIAAGFSDWALRIQNSGGFARGSFPFLYLGVPIYRGIKRTDMFLFLRDKIAKRINGWGHRHLSFGGRLTLIRSTLEAIPIHIFQSIEPTAGIIKQLEQQLARFFWGASSDNKKTHWISWEQICLPTAEGGLGIRRFKEVLRAFSAKLWWRLREKTSLWAEYMLKKYCSKASPLSPRLPSNCSPTWRRLARAWPQTHPHVRWVLGDGSCSFWDDIWLEDSPLRDLSLDDRGSPMTQVAELWSNGSWCPIKLRTLQQQAGIPQRIVESILSTPILQGTKDIPRWTLSTHGKFTLSSAWEIHRSRGPEIPGLKDLWHKGITQSMSIFFWRLLSNRIPVDAKLQWRKISLASKCLCCFESPSIETLVHLFIQGRGARDVWRFFDTWFEGRSHPLRDSDSIPTRLELWAMRLKQSAKRHITRTLPCLILWFLWAERNNSRHNESAFHARHVIWQVQMHIHNLNSRGLIEEKHWNGCSSNALRRARAEDRRIPARTRIVTWSPPDPPWIKLNSKGMFISFSGQAAGGGLLRDAGGRLITAFALPIQARSQLEADIRTAASGISMAQHYGAHIWLETDSAQSVSILQGDDPGPAATRHEVARVRSLRHSINLRVTFIHREGNKPAGELAKRGLGSLIAESMNAISCPPPNPGPD